MKIDYTLVRSKKRRKTTVIEVRGENNIIVRAPMRVSTQHVTDFVAKNQDWIIQKIALIKKRPPAPSIQLTEGSFLPYMGASIPLRIYRNGTKKVSFRLDANTLIADIPQNYILNDDSKSRLISWYKQSAKKVISSRVNFYAAVIGKKYNRISIKEVRSIWGSCSSNSNLNFNWRLLLAPAEIIDYIVIHEVCHLIYRGHSKHFWQKVAELDPEYKKHQLWLKNNGPTLTI